LPTVATTASEVGAFGCSGMAGRIEAHPLARSETQMARAKRTGLTSLEDVEDTAGLLDLGG
jgi:hypothetical protein